MIIIDTNVISELQKPNPNVNVVKWLDQQEPTNLYITAITVAELWYGVYCLPDGKRAKELEAAVEYIVEDLFGDRVLPFDELTSFYYGRNMANARRQGKSIGIADGQIAAIAFRNNLAPVATRDTAPFEAFRVTVINPFLEPDLV